MWLNIEIHGTPTKSIGETIKLNLDDALFMTQFPVAQFSVALFSVAFFPLPFLPFTREELRVRTSLISLIWIFSRTAAINIKFLCQ